MRSGVAEMYEFTYEDDDGVSHLGYHVNEYVANITAPHNGVAELVHVQTRAVLYIADKASDDERARVIFEFLQTHTPAAVGSGGVGGTRGVGVGAKQEVCIWARRDDIALFASTYLPLISTAARKLHANAHVRELETLFHTRRFFPTMLSWPIYSDFNPLIGYSSPAAMDAASVYIIRMFDRMWSAIVCIVLSAIIAILLLCVIKFLIG